LLWRPFAHRRTILAALALTLILLAAGCGETSSTPSDKTTPPKKGGIEQATSEPKADPPDPRGSYRLTCDYLLGNEVDSYTLIGGGTVENVGNVGIQVRVKVKWEQLGGEPIRDEQTFSLRIGKRKRVSFNMPTTSDVIDRLQSAANNGRSCSINATIVESEARSTDSQGSTSVSQAAAPSWPAVSRSGRGQDR